MTEQHDPRQDWQTSYIGFGISIGVGAGIALGAGIGTAIGTALAAPKKR